MVHLTKNWRPRRSVLFMPASNTRAMEKARTLACDGVIFDLEDSVAESARDEARSNMIKIAGSGDYGRRERIVRTNIASSPEFSSDLKAALEISPDAILLPKLESEATLADVRNQIGEGGPALWAMIETATAILEISEIARAAPKTGLSVLVIGPNDLAKSIGVSMKPDRRAMLPWFGSVIAPARAFDLAVLDGVFNNFSDIDGFEAECEQGAELGFDGKTLIHPSQIDAANRIFSPDEADIERARKIVAAYNLPANKNAGVINLDGEMVERLHLESANQLLQVVGKFELSENQPPKKSNLSRYRNTSSTSGKKSANKLASSQSETTLYRFLTGFDDTAFSHKITQALDEGWELHGPTQFVVHPTTGKIHCGQAVIKKTGEPYDPERTLSEYQTFR
ncbi:MAG: aldolase/citrate lyase family protein [Rhizobiaceae bacterium]